MGLVNRPANVSVERSSARRIDELGSPGSHRPLDHPDTADDVHVGVVTRVGDRGLDAWLRRQMKDDLGPAPLDEDADRRVTHVDLVEAELTSCCARRPEVGKRAGREVVYYVDGVFFGKETVNEVRADESGP